jgi:hypothetical protein
MFRKLLILGAIATLFTIVTVVPASAIAVETGPDGTPQTVLDNGPQEESSPAHGPICAFDGGPKLTCTSGATNSQGAPAGHPLLHPVSSLGINAGAWNAVFGPGGVRNLNSAICGIVVVTEGDTEICFVPPKG